MKKLIGFLVLTLLIAACTKPTTGVRAIPQEPTLFTDLDLDSASLELAHSAHEAGKTEEVISAEVSRLPALTQGGSASLSTQAVLPNAAGFLYYIEQNPSSATQPWRIYRFDQYNEINTLVYAGTRAIQAIAGSEDGKVIAVSMRETSAATSDYEIYKLNLNPLQATRLTSNSVDDTHVSMSADTAVIVWEQPNMGRQTIVYRKHNIENVLALRVAQHQPSVSSNGRYIVLTRDLTGGGTQVYRYDLINQSYAAIPVSPLGQPLLEHPSISDDGRHIAYLQGGNQLVLYTLPESSGLATSQVIVSGATLEHPFLTADAQFVTYGKPQNNSSWLYIKSLATGTERLLTHPASPVMHLGMMWVVPFATQQILPLHSSIEPSVPSRFDFRLL
ncbi:MAG: hypothetical protein KC422_17835 [Trueperaceae bacterium]|nr:hypothetical protein [Trueperaceae bacterium]